MHNTIIHCNHNVLIKHVHVVAIKLKVPNEFIPLLNTVPGIFFHPRKYLYCMYPLLTYQDLKSFN